MEDWRTWPFAPQPGTVLCMLAEIPDKGAKEVVFGEGYDCFRVLLLRSQRKGAKVAPSPHPSPPKHGWRG
jgi:hypothetical protein